MKYNKAVYYGTVGLIAGGMLKNSRKREDFAMKRIGQVIKVKPEYLEKYKALHANPWPEVNEMITLYTIGTAICFLILSIPETIMKRI